jgi:hypothetical protein
VILGVVASVVGLGTYFSARPCAGRPFPTSITLDRYAGEFEQVQRIRDDVRSKIVASGFGAKI